MAMAMSTSSSSRLPSSSRSIHLTKKKRKNDGGDRGAIAEFLRIVRRDGDFMNEKLRFFGNKTRPLRDRMSRTVGDFFWLRHLEDPNKVDKPRSLSALPEFSYHPGLSGMDLLMADLEALKVYANYLRSASQLWSTPLPEVYDPQRVADYFSCRPHVLVFRMLEVFSTFASAAIKLQVCKNFMVNGHSVGSSDGLEYYTGQLLKESILNLGPTFVKVGQSLSTRPDIIGSEISQALSELHDKIPPFPREIAMKIIEEEFGSPVENIFSYISEEPVAAASFGQVYRGCTLDGSIVAIKVQRPNLLHAVVRDVYILRLGLAVLRKIAKRKSDPCLYADELGKGLVGELEYTFEAANAAKFLEAHSRYSFMAVPKVFRHLTRKRVLTMEWMVGANPSDLLLQSREQDEEKIKFSEGHQLKAKTDLLDLVNKGVEASLVQLLETGLLHADPHPGNLCYTPEGRIGFLDFGLLCQMEKKHQLAMLASIIHIVNGDWEALVYDLALMDIVRPGTNLRRVAMDLEESLGEVVIRDGIPDIKFSRMLGKIWSVALKYHFRMPPYYTLVLRSLASLEGLALAADPQFKTFQAAYPYVVEKLLYDNSASIRTILYSVVFNKRRELQWQKILMFLRLGSLRKSAHGINIPSMSKSSEHRTNVHGDVLDAAIQILRLLSSKNGSVLRRLLLTADVASLTQSMVSKDAAIIRQHVSRALADVFHKWVLKTIGLNKSKLLSLDDHYHLSELERRQDADTDLYTTALSLETAFRDRRLRVIFYKKVKDLRRHPVVMLRACWCCFTVFATASALALRRIVVSWLEMFSASIAFTPKRFAAGL